MSGKVVILFAETHIHPGVGQSTGALDLPVARERTTHYPFIPGSGVKGAFRVWAREQAGMKDDKLEKLFGKGGGDAGNDEGAGSLLLSDARLLLLPVRCLSDAFKWVTCPAMLGRFRRDCIRSGEGDGGLPETIIVTPGQYLGVKTIDDPLGLEEREFARGGDVPVEVLRAFVPLVNDAELKQRLVILSDRDFTWFARYALPVMARNALDENKKVKSGALWYEESLPSDSLMYVLVGERNSGTVETLSGHIAQAPYIQMGGNETIGQGWFKMSVPGGGNNG